jgi:hypothetical protein
MALWITTKHLLHHQDEKSFHTRNQENAKLGHPTDNMDIPWVQPCIITDVKTCTLRPRPVNASSIHLSFSLQFHNATIVVHRQIDHGRQRNFQCIKNPHPEVLSHIGDETKAALTTLAEIFKNKFQKVQTHGLPNVPASAAEHTLHSNLSHPILASPVQRQTRSQAIFNTKDTTNAP